MPRLVNRWTPSSATSMMSSCWPPANIVTSLPKNSSQEPAWTGSHSAVTPLLASWKRPVSGFIWSARPGAPSRAPLTEPVGAPAGATAAGAGAVVAAAGAALPAAAGAVVAAAAGAVVAAAAAGLVGSAAGLAGAAVGGAAVGAGA